MDEIKAKLELVKQAGKLDQIKLYGEIIDLAPQYAPDQLFLFFDELLSLVKAYTAFDPKPPREVTDSLSNALLNVFARIRNTSDVPAFVQYAPLYLSLESLLSGPVVKARIYQVFGYMYWLQNDIEESIHFLTASLHILNENAINDEFPERYTNLGFVYEYIGDYKHAEKLYRDGLKFAKQHNYEKALISAYSGMGRLNLQLKKFRSAVQYLESGLALAGDKGMNRELATIMVNLAIAYLNLKDYDRALELNLQLDNKTLENNDQELYFTVILNIGCCYSDKGEYSLARPYFTKAYDYAQSKGDIPQVIFSLLNLGRICKQESHLPQALEYLNAALSHAEKADNQRQLLSIHTLMGEVFALMNEYGSALSQFEKASHITDTTLDIIASPELALSIATCHEKLGNFQQAYHYLLTYIRLWEEAKQKQDEPDEEIKSNKQISTGKKSHYVFSDSMSLISRELSENIGHWLIGTSKELQEVVEKAYIAAQNDTINVMIYGESGTGKELIARLIHHAGGRSKLPFIEVNSAVFTTSLAESSLFGHKKGAFTGASDNHIGYFEAAHRGTLFLDEISEMPSEIQSMMLRVLETKQIKPLGSNGLVKVDFRLICASNQDIRKLADSDNFRFDLFSRINALEIHIPPLRERKSDIPLMINYYLASLSEAMNIKSPLLSSPALDKLCDYHYPGNIRELKNILQRLLLFNKKAVIDADDLIFTTEVRPADSLETADFDLEANEKRLILAALNKSHGVVTNAANLLGLSPFALARRIKKFDLKSSS